MTLSKALIVQHVPWEKPGRILDSFDDCGLASQTINILENGKSEIPDIADISGLVIMGGPMGALDVGTYPGLRIEAKLVRKAVRAEIPVLGVCLGHQIIATALGGELEHGKRQEIGFAPITKVGSHEYFSMWDKQLQVLHWHGDKVTLPEGAQLLASSSDTENQAFVYKTALGMQFHMEVTAALLEEWLSEPRMTEGLKKSQVKKIREDYERYVPGMQALADQVFGSFAARCKTYAQAEE
ncbi:type 1 glutamine amidotransferase [Bifidobacterium bombi]|uniref:Amidotransferase n=1 Tax=Bifidobacterium bombi DSM 19703 TaxID=1341695 RepID=A0A086BNN0_9BIFI|nr:type 1 glutamine amidotransferase [Bifidobacterium bombi]KFF30544.1 amidotransferase [Bifidobacterium bombi DSM 19703]